MSTSSSGGKGGARVARLVSEQPSVLQVLSSIPGVKTSLRHKGYSVLRGSCISCPSQRMCRPPLDLRVRATNAVNSGEKHKSFSTTPSLQVHIVGHLTVSTTNMDENFDLNQMFLPKVDTLHQINLYLPPVVEKLDSAIQRITHYPTDKC